MWMGGGGGGIRNKRELKLLTVAIRSSLKWEMNTLFLLLWEMYEHRNYYWCCGWRKLDYDNWVACENDRKKSFAIKQKFLIHNRMYIVGSNWHCICKLRITGEKAQNCLGDHLPVLNLIPVERNRVGEEGHVLVGRYYWLEFKMASSLQTPFNHP